MERLYLIILEGIMTAEADPNNSLSLLSMLRKRANPL